MLFLLIVSYGRSGGGPCIRIFISCGPMLRVNARYAKLEEALTSIIRTRGLRPSKLLSGDKVMKELGHDAHIVDHLRMIDPSSIHLDSSAHFTAVYTSGAQRKHSIKVTRLERQPSVDVQVIDARLHQREHVRSERWTDDVTLCTQQRFSYGDDFGLCGVINDVKLKRLVRRIWAWHHKLAIGVTK